MRTPHAPRRRTALVASLLGGAAVVLALAGCAATAMVAPTPARSVQARQGAGGPNGQGRGGVFGLIAAAQNGVLQVQGDGEQTTVRYTGATTVQRATTQKASAIAIGDCIMAVTTRNADAATSITVTAASAGGTCTNGFGGFGGSRPSGAPTALPSPGASYSGRGGGFGRVTTGKVIAATASSLTVQATARDGSTTSEKVALSSATTVTVTKAASVKDIARGLCVRANGKADDKGGFDATSLTLSAASSDGTCTSGFGFVGRGQRPGTGQTGTGTTNG